MDMQFATERVEDALRMRPRGLFTDVDGTISAIAPTPEAATLLPGVREVLERAREVFDLVAAVSGRAAADAARMVGLEGILYIGNHGFERLERDEVRVVPEAEPFVGAIGAALDEAERALAPAWPGLRVERKGVTGSVHVRATADPRRAEAAALETMRRLAEPAGLRVTRGKMVIELRPPVGMSKGVAVDQEIRAHGLRGALYLGDDRTDLDAFRALRRLTETGICRGVAVAVDHAEAPGGLSAAADVALAGIEQVPEFLQWVVERAGTLDGKAG